MTKQIWRRNVDVAFGIVTQPLHLGFLLQIEGTTKKAKVEAIIKNKVAEALDEVGV